MTSHTAQSAVPFGAITVHNLVGMFTQASKAVVAWNARRVTRRALVRLSDAQLNDIGLTFKDIRNFPIEAGKY